MIWSPQQSSALLAAGSWLADCRSEMRSGRTLSRPVFRLFGYAGTGKTTLAVHLASGVSFPVFAAFTGKAALMMQRNRCTNACTIHSLIYRPEVDEFDEVRFVLNEDSDASTSDLIVIDECSMVGPDLGADLMSYGRPILVLGDPAQLPPVKGAGFFTDHPPDILLTEIHRQAAESPIIMLATDVRLGKRLSLGEYGSSRVIPRGSLTAKDVSAFDQVLVGRNRTRRTYNRRLRLELGFSSPFPEVNDRLVCLKNDKNLGIFNGGIFTVLKSDLAGNSVSMTVSSDDFEGRSPIPVNVRREFFNGDPADIPKHALRVTQQFDFGYALTVHKSQGSQWHNVIIYDESEISGDDWHRWLYTAITRAAESVTVVI